MTTVLGCIADDFTGATDIAGLLARSGVRVSLRIGVPEGPPRDTAAFEVIALKSRTAPVGEALAETRAALRWLQAAGAQRFFWKYCSTFDSTSEGNIGPVARGQALRPPLSLIALSAAIAMWSANPPPAPAAASSSAPLESADRSVPADQPVPVEFIKAHPSQRWKVQALGRRRGTGKAASGFTDRACATT